MNSNEGRSDKAADQTAPEWAVIFDFDGTLADSMGAWRRLEAELCAQAGVEDSDEVVRALGPLSIPEVAEFFHGRYGLGDSPDEVIDLIDRAMSRGYSEDVFAKPGAGELVRALHELGVPMALVSSTPHHLLDLGLEALGLSSCIPVVVSVDDVGHSKREPHAFLAASEAMGVTPSQTWVFEDSVYAIKTAKAAGYRCFAVHDQDESGTIEELRAVADRAEMSLEGLDPKTLALTTV